MNPSDILVSVAIVTRDRQDLLSRAIISARRQTHSPMEIVVVDNASQDNTVAMVERDWPDVRMIRLLQNVGCQPGRNIAMANCRGQYIFNLDDDGELEANAIERIVERFEANPDIAVIECSTPSRENGHVPQADGAVRERWQANFRGGASCIRASVLQCVAGFPEFRRAGSEMVLAAWILDKGYEILHLPDAVMYHPKWRQGRTQRDHSYYAGWHYLKRSFIYLPFPQCLGNAFWRCLRGFAEAIQSRYPGAYAKGVLRFFLDLPDVLEKRNPIRRATWKKIQFLSFHHIDNKSDIAQFNNLSAFQLWCVRWKRWK